MRKFLITNWQVYEGEIVVIYDEEHQLSSIDMKDTNLTPAQCRGVLKNIPVTIEELLKCEWSKTAICVESTYIVSFDEFWKSYPNKVNKSRSKKLFDSLSVADRYMALVGLKNYKKHLGYHQWKECKSPDTYIRNRNWEDEYR